MICHHEGCKLKPYRDTGGNWTIGIGHLIPAGEPVPDEITATVANRLFHSDLGVHEAELGWWLHSNQIPINQKQFDALVDFHFNIGGPRFRASGVANRLKTGNLDGAPRGFFDWTLSGGKRSKGLLTRRYNEARVYWFGQYP